MSQTIYPMLAYADGVGAIDWLTHAFGFRDNADVRQVQLEGHRWMFVERES